MTKIEGQVKRRFLNLYLIIRWRSYTYTKVTSLEKNIWINREQIITSRTNGQKKSEDDSP